MHTAEFEEPAFELAANVDLSVHGSIVWSPGRVLEGVLGFDAAALVPNPAAWSVVRTASGFGMPLVPSLLTGWTGITPRTFPRWHVSLILQYKRPNVYPGRRARHHRHFGGPYFGFSTRVRQQQTLLQLETTTASNAVIRYASPAFWTMSALSRCLLRHRVLNRTVFAAPSAIGAHRRWFYNRPGTTGLTNPKPEPTKADDWQHLRNLLVASAREVALADHLIALAKQVGEVVPLPEIPSTFDVDLEALRVRQGKMPVIRAFVQLNRVFHDLGLAWVVIALGTRESDPIGESADPFPFPFEPFTPDWDVLDLGLT